MFRRRKKLSFADRADRLTISIIHNDVEILKTSISDLVAIANYTITAGHERSLIHLYPRIVFPTKESFDVKIKKEA